MKWKMKFHSKTLRKWKKFCYFLQFRKLAFISVQQCLSRNWYRLFLVFVTHNQMKCTICTSFGYIEIAFLGERIEICKVIELSNEGGVRAHMTFEKQRHSYFFRDNGKFRKGNKYFSRGSGVKFALIGIGKHKSSVSTRFKTIKSNKDLFWILFSLKFI